MPDTDDLPACDCDGNYGPEESDNVCHLPGCHFHPKAPVRKETLEQLEQRIDDYMQRDMG